MLWQFWEKEKQRTLGVKTFAPYKVEVFDII
jgi:hypothetical protein